MKFLAIFKDSLREALDTKVFLVMLCLSGVLVVIVLSLSFTPSGPEAMMRTMLDPLNGRTTSFGPGGAHIQQIGGNVQYSLSGVEPLTEADSPEEQSYRVTVMARHFGNIAIVLPGKPDPQRRARERKDVKALRETFGKFGDFRAVEVTEVRPALTNNRFVAKQKNAGDQYYEVTTRPASLTAQFWPHYPTVLFGLIPMSGLEAPLGVEVYFIEDLLVNNFGGFVALILSVIITAFFIPNMLRKGTLDLLLSKPISRPTLFVYKYIGGLTFIFLNATVAIGGVWLALGIRSGVWAPGFLLCIPVITFFFAILYAGSALFGLLTRSPTSAVLMTLGMWFLFYMVGQAYITFKVFAKIEEAQNTPPEKRITDGWWVPTVNTIHFVLPRTSDLNVLSSKVLRTGLISRAQLQNQIGELESITWAESLTVSLVFIGVMLSLACWRFAVKDY
jgi:ABC-type transport system involved in multi-copper enzyme maturation permease subunit